MGIFTFQQFETSGLLLPTKGVSLLYTTISSISFKAYFKKNMQKEKKKNTFMVAVILHKLHSGL